MIALLTTTLAAVAAFALGRFNDPVGRELDDVRSQVELRNVMTPLFGGSSDR
jgi:hypothetical protein